MTMKRTEITDTDTSNDALLDPFFAEARTLPPMAPAHLMASVLADAQRLQPAAASLPKSRARPAQRLDFRQWLPNWPTGAALAGFLAAGVFLGYAQPETLAPVSDAVAPVFGTVASDDDGYFSLDDLMTEI